MNTKITPEIMLAIQERAAMGHSLREISKWLKDKHDIVYSHISVKKVIDKNRKMRHEISQEILKPILEKRLTTDLDILESAIKECQDTIELAKSKGDQKMKMAALDRLDKFLRLSFKVKGIETEDSEAEELDLDYNKIMQDFSFIESKKSKKDDQD